RRRHGRRTAAVPRGRGRCGPELQYRQPALDRDDLRPGAPHPPPDRRERRHPLHAARVHRRRAPDPERRQGTRAPQLRAEGRARRRPGAHDRVVQGAKTGAPLIRLARPDVGPEEIAAAAEVLESGQLTMGPEVGELETALAAACARDHAVAVSSGTAALHPALLAAGIGPGDEVLLPAYTFPATANVVALVGAHPVLVDVDPVTMNLDPELAAAAVTPRTRAVL